MKIVERRKGMRCIEQVREKGEFAVCMWVLDGVELLSARGDL